VTSASHDLALAWHPVLSSSFPLLSSLLSLDVYIHTQIELIAFRSSAPGRDRTTRPSRRLRPILRGLAYASVARAMLSQHSRGPTCQLFDDGCTAFSH
jgi:hypothetical protein